MNEKMNKKILQIVTYIMFLVLPVMFFISLEAVIIYFGASLIFLLIFSYILDASFPEVGAYLEKQYFQNNFKISYIQKERISVKNSLKNVYYQLKESFLYYLIVLSKSSKGSFRITREKIYQRFTEVVEKQANVESRLVFANDVIQKMKRKDDVTLDQIEKLESIIFEYYRSLNRKIRAVSISSLSLAIVLTSVLSSLIFPNISKINAATYGWVQTDWAGGASTSATAFHATDQTGWNQYYSKTSNLDTSGGELTQINAASEAWIETEDVDFTDNGIANNTYITGGEIVTLKSEGASCSSHDECVGSCVASVCNDSWFGGSCSGIVVALTDLPLNYRWQNAQSSCIDPQCVNDILVSSNSVDFSDYPARQACKDTGGRLPSRSELLCIYNNQGDYGNNFYGSYYWTSYEGEFTSAWRLRFYNGVESLYNKTISFTVRCVLTN